MARYSAVLFTQSRFSVPWPPAVHFHQRVRLAKSPASFVASTFVVATEAVSPASTAAEALLSLAGGAAWAVGARHKPMASASSGRSAFMKVVGRVVVAGNTGMEVIGYNDGQMFFELPP